jgi:nucleoside-diphosphate-sugar epimerase
VKLTVVGCEGTLGRLLCKHFDARGVDLRHAGDLLGATLPPIGEADVVVDVAGPRVRPGLGWSDYLREHVGTSLAIARAVRPGAHLIHVSSASVYGSGRGVLQPSAPEAPALFPNPSYAWAKLAGELAARATCKERGVTLSVVRFPVVYGPGVESAIDTLLSLARRGVLLDLMPGEMPQHLLHVSVLYAAVERLAAGGTLMGSTVVADPFVLTNADVTSAVARRYPPRLRVPVPLSQTNRILYRWPGFPERDAPPKLAAFGVLGLSTAFAWEAAYEHLGLDPQAFSRDKTFDRYIDGSAGKNENERGGVA